MTLSSTLSVVVVSAVREMGITPYSCSSQGTNLSTMLHSLLLGFLLKLLICFLAPLLLAFAEASHEVSVKQQQPACQQQHHHPLQAQLTGALQGCCHNQLA